MKLLEDIKKELRPDDLVLKEVDRFISDINDKIRKECVKARCVRGGSTAKGTFLKGDYDVDLFVIFDYSYKKEDISKMLSDIINSLKPDLVHGSRDYFQIKKGKLTYEIVPVLEVKDPKDIQNVTDMSPHHVAWVNKRANDALRDEIRLAKKFCKAQKVYGAESYIKGFSGHVLDILIINYGGFLDLLKASLGWKPKIIIDIEKHWQDPMRNLDRSKTYGPMVVVDPIQPDRNAAAGLSDEKLEKFIQASKLFLIEPSKSFFVDKEFDVDKIDRGKNVLVVIDVKASKGKTDIVGAKIMKTYEFIKKGLKQNDFTVEESDWKWDKKKTAQMYFLIKEHLLPKTFVRTGPPLKEKPSCKAFKAKNDDVFEKTKRLYANIKRYHRNPRGLVSCLIKEEYVTKKVERIKAR